MSLLTDLIIENSHTLTGLYFMFPKKHNRPNMKGFQYQIWIPVKRLRN